MSTIDEQRILEVARHEIGHAFAFFGRELLFKEVILFTKDGEMRGQVTNYRDNSDQFAILDTTTFKPETEPWQQPSFQEAAKLRNRCTNGILWTAADDFIIGIAGPLTDAIFGGSSVANEGFKSVFPYIVLDVRGSGDAHKVQKAVRLRELALKECPDHPEQRESDSEWRRGKEAFVEQKLPQPTTPKEWYGKLSDPSKTLVDDWFAEGAEILTSHKNGIDEIAQVLTKRFKAELEAEVDRPRVTLSCFKFVGLVAKSGIEIDSECWKLAQRFAPTRI